MTELIAVYTILYALCMTIFGVVATFCIQTDIIGVKELLFDEVHSKESALRKLNMITNSHFGLLVITTVTLLSWEGHIL